MSRFNSFINYIIEIRNCIFKGAGGLYQDFLEIDFLVVSNSLIERCNIYQKLFTKLKNIALSLKYCWSKVSAVV